MSLLADDAAAGALEACFKAADYAAAVERADKLLARWPDSPMAAPARTYAAAAQVQLGRKAFDAGD